MTLSQQINSMDQEAFNNLEVERLEGILHCLVVYSAIENSLMMYLSTWASALFVEQTLERKMR